MTKIKRIEEFTKSKWDDFHSLYRQLPDKAELLQLNQTQFPSLGIFVSKKVGNQKTKTTFIISVLKVVYYVVLVFLKSNSFTNKNSQGRKLSAK